MTYGIDINKDYYSDLCDRLTLEECDGITQVTYATGYKKIGGIKMDIFNVIILKDIKSKKTPLKVILVVGGLKLKKIKLDRTECVKYGVKLELDKAIKEIMDFLSALALLVKNGDLKYFAPKKIMIDDPIVDERNILWVEKILTISA